jgi:hypothetical protein
MEKALMNNTDFRETIKRLEAVNAIILKLDPNIRGAAFELFKPYLTETLACSTSSGGETPTALSSSSPSLVELMQKHPNAPAHENAYLLAAHWFSVYGSEPFSLEGVRELGNNAGLTVPERLDMTYKQAKSEGKAIFQPVERGTYRPTVAGEGWLRSTFGVSKGTQKPPSVVKP